MDILASLTLEFRCLKVIYMRRIDIVVPRSCARVSSYPTCATSVHLVMSVRVSSHSVAIDWGTRGLGVQAWIDQRVLIG